MTFSPVSLSTACEDAATPAIPECLRCASGSGHLRSRGVGELGGPQRVSIFFFLSLNMVPGCFFMSAVGVAHTSCVCGTGGLLPSLRGWVANLMLTEPGDVKGKFILTPTKTVMETSGKIPAGGFGDRKEIRLSSPVA